MTPASLWRAIDKIAEQNGKSPCGLARISKLNQTTFNPSKRVYPDGRVRWPKLETIDKVCRATNTSMLKFMYIVAECEKLKNTPPHGGDFLF